MILDKTVRIKMNVTTYNWYLSKGYQIPSHVDARNRSRTFKRGSILEVRVEDLPPKSNTRLLAQCEVCHQARMIAYNTYSAVCWQCNLTKQKGLLHPRYDASVTSKGEERTFDLYLRRKYNITIYDYFSLMEKQNHRCEICSIAMANDGRRFAVDHKHDTKKVRGLLCQSCNTALGLFKENLVSIGKALQYLKRNE